MLGGGLGCVNPPTEGDSVTVAYNANGGQVSPIAKTVSAGEVIVLPEPVRKNYAFIGWYTALDDGTRVGGTGDDYTVKTNTTLYAQWVSGITVYYSPNGGIVSPQNEVVSVGGSVTLPTPSRGGYVFKGWYNVHGEKVGNAGDKYAVVGESFFQGGVVDTLLAEWRLLVTVIFNLNGGSDSLPSVMEPTEGSITLPTPVRSGYIFDGWYTSLTGDTKAGDAGGLYTIPITSAATLQLFARWIPAEVTVTYNANGGSVLPLTETVLAGSSVILPSPTNSGYTFSGWYSALFGGRRVGGAGDSYRVETNSTLYAQWV